jgi:hypothetical protein
MQFEAQRSTFGCAGCIYCAGFELIARPKFLAEFVKAKGHGCLLGRESVVSIARPISVDRDSTARDGLSDRDVIS